MHNSNIGPFNLSLPSVSGTEPKTGKTVDAGGAEKPPSVSLLQRLATAVTVRRFVQFTLISGMVSIVLFWPPGWIAAITVLLGSIALIQSNGWPNDPIFSCLSKGA